MELKEKMLRTLNREEHTDLVISSRATITKELVVEMIRRFLLENTRFMPFAPTVPYRKVCISYKVI